MPKILIMPKLAEREKAGKKPERSRSVIAENQPPQTHKNDADHEAMARWMVLADQALADASPSHDEKGRSGRHKNKQSTVRKKTSA